MVLFAISMSVKKLALPKRDAHLLLEELAIIHGCVHEPIQIRKLVALHKLEQMLRVQMLKQQTTWMRENGFDRVETLADKYEQTLRRLHADFASEPFYTELCNAQRPPTLEEFTVVLKVKVERFSVLLSQPLPSKLPPRRSPAQPPQQPCSVLRVTTDTGKMERGTQGITVDPGAC